MSVSADWLACGWFCKKRFIDSYVVFHLGEALWPSLALMKDRDDFEAVSSQAVRNHVTCAGNHELARSGDSAWTTKIRQLSQTFDGGQEHSRHAASRGRVIARKVCPKVREMFDRARRPDDSHPCGAFRSRVRPHERSQVDTSL
jgi:hypothetical protein